jgi:uncharacterized protein
MNSILRASEHRPWPIPSGPWIMKQIWHNLLFAHWPLPETAIRPLVPAQLSLDTFDGQCWVGVIPFYMTGISARGLPPIPGLSSSEELNVRTYVNYGGKPGVYFFSLDAASLPAVWAARTFYHLPYFHAVMKLEESNGKIFYFSSRRSSPAEFRGWYHPTSEVQLAERGSLPHWLTERYCLYTTHRGGVYRCEIHHLRWPLQDAGAKIEMNTMASATGITLPDVSPMLHFARRLKVLIWPLRRAE